MESFVIILLVMVVIMLCVGFYFIFVPAAQNVRHSEGASAVRIVGSEKSIISVRKVEGTQDYEIKVEEIPYVDAYAAGEFLSYEESPFERWMRDDISHEERMLLHEEIKRLYGVDINWDSEVEPEEGQLDDGEDDDRDLQDGIVPQDPDQSRNRVNKFDYDPFEQVSHDGEDEEDHSAKETDMGDVKEGGGVQEDEASAAEDERMQDAAVAQEESTKETEGAVHADARPRRSGYDWGNLGF